MKRAKNALFVIVIFLFLVTLAFLAADYIRENSHAQSIVERFGYLGVFVIAFITGLNVIVPVPAASFTPIFLAANLNFGAIIAVLAVGTTIADSIGYIIGRYGKPVAEVRYPKIYEKLRVLNERYHYLVLPGMFLYASLVPFPNEIILIPLGLLGLRFSTLMLPLLLGNVVSQTIYTYGFNEVFEFFF